MLAPFMVGHNGRNICIPVLFSYLCVCVGFNFHLPYFCVGGEGLCGRGRHLVLGFLGLRWMCPNQVVDEPGWQLKPGTTLFPSKGKDNKKRTRDKTRENTNILRHKAGRKRSRKGRQKMPQKPRKNISKAWEDGVKEKPEKCLLYLAV